MYQDKHDQAIAEAEKLAATARNDGDRRLAFFTKTMVYADQGRTNRALQEMDKQYGIGSKAQDNGQMAADANTTGTILLNAGRIDQAQKRFQQALDIQANSTLPAEVKEDAKLGHHYYLARIALAKNDLATAKSEAAEYQKGSEAKQNQLRTQQAHELNGTIALSEKSYDSAISELEKASQQDPYVTYQLALAYDGKGDKAKAADLYKRAANAYILPTLNYVFIREKAKQRAAAQPTS
jgi:tetratricopeptide (TPR) repeat protein